MIEVTLFLFEDFNIFSQKVGIKTCETNKIDYNSVKGLILNDF